MRVSGPGQSAGRAPVGQGPTTSIPPGSVLDVPIAELRPIAPNTATAVEPADVASILLVVDLTNAAPGRSGILRVRSSALMR